jgi:tape measure domain-containing protein
MGQQIGSLYASMSLESASFLSGLERATKATDRASKAIEKGMDRASLAVKGFVAAFVADKTIDGAAKFLEIADSSKKMESQMKLATAQFGNQGQAMRDTNAIAKETRSEIESINDLYAKFMPTTKELGRSQLDNARATETFAKAMKVSQASTQEQMSASLQMGQALSGTNVQWEELGQIMEASPRLARLFTESLGVTRGELKKMAEDGKLTSKMLYDALTNTKMTAQIDAEFKELPKTWEDSKTLMENALNDLIGAFDRGAGISEGIVEAMGEGTDAIDLITQVAEEAGVDIRAVFMGLDNVFDPMGENSSNVMAAIRKDAEYTRETIGNLLRFIDKAHNAYAWADNLGTRAENFITGGNKPLKDENWDMGDDFDRGYQKSRVESARNRLVRTIRINGGNDYKKFDGKGLSDKQLQDVSKKVYADIKAGRNVVHGTGKTPPKPKDEKADKAAETARNKAQRAADKAAREAERAAETERRNKEAFVADLNRSAREELDSKADLASVASERFNFERQKLDVERKSRLDQIDKDGPEGSKRYSAAQVAELKAIEERITLNRGQAITLEEEAFKTEERLKLVGASLDNAVEIAQLDVNMARTAKDRRAAEHRLLDLRVQQEKLALEAIIASRASTEAEKQIARARLALIPKLAERQGQQIDEQTKGPLGAYLDSIPRTGDEINEALEDVQVRGLEGLKGGLMDAIKGVGSLGDAFSNMADTVIDGLLDIALQQLLIKPLGSVLFGGDSGGGGLLGGIIGGISKAASGGLTGKANGGRGNRGRYLVGEHGPEVVEMNAPFHVTPNHKLEDVRGSSVGGVNVTFGSITSNDPAAVKAMAIQAIAEMAPMLTTNAKNATIAELRRPRM